VGLLLKGENEEVPNRTSGNLILNTERLTIRDGAQISGFTVGNGDGGNLNITASDIYLQNGSGITARAAQDSSGGNITINTDSLILQNSNITADAEVGRGGNIAIQTELLFRDSNSLISATSALGIDGTVTLNTPTINPNSGLIEVPDTPIDVTRLIGQDPCSQPQNSELIFTGRGGLPPSPQESLRSEETWVELMELNFEEHSDASNVTLNRQQNPEKTSNQPLSSLEIVPARGWIRNENGDVILVSYDPTQTGVQQRRPSVNQCQF
jgi:large exoprotein involved in heme utilization and adhesion